MIEVRSDLVLASRLLGFGLLARAIGGGRLRVGGSLFHRTLSTAAIGGVRLRFLHRTRVCTPSCRLRRRRAGTHAEHSEQSNTRQYHTKTIFPHRRKSKLHGEGAIS